MLSIALGLALAIFFVALQSGGYAQLIEKAVRMQGGHISLEHPGYRQARSVELSLDGVGELRRKIDKMPGVERTKVLVIGQGLLKSGHGSAGVMVIGVEPGVEAKLSPVAERVTAGRYLRDGDMAGVVIGRDLATQLKVEPGRKAVLAAGNTAGQMTEELLVVSGVFCTGTPEVDGYVVHVPIDFARKVYGLGLDRATQIGVIAREPGRVGSLRRDILGIAGDGKTAVLPWQEVLPEISSITQFVKAVNILYQVILIFLMMFTVFNTLLMSVVERQREFAVLLAIGTPPRLLKLQVFVESTIIGLIGCTAGLVIGGVGAYVAGVHGLDMRGWWIEGANVSGCAFDLVVRPRLTAFMLLWLGLLAFGSTVLLSIYPFRLAARVKIAEWLR